MGAFVYGPVPSRRLGRSLGLDIVSPKSCTANCVYCQIGSREPLPPIRKRFFPPEKIETDLESAIKSDGEVDWITFSGSGEPTLSLDLERLIVSAKSHGVAPVCVLTNGTLLSMPDVRKELMAADLVVPNLDAATPELFQKVVRPHAEIDFYAYISGLKLFAGEFDGDLHLEIVLIKDINDSEEHFHQLAELVGEISPGGVWIGTVKRPPAEVYVHPVDDSVLAKASEIIGQNTEIITEFKLSSGDFIVFQDLRERVFSILKRRPETAEGIANSLSANPHVVLKILTELETDKTIIRKSSRDSVYYDLTRS